MDGLGLRAHGLSVVLFVLLGPGIGLGWHYVVDGAGVRAVASAPTFPAQHEAANPSSANPPSQGLLKERARVLMSPALQAHPMRNKRPKAERLTFQMKKG
jgi:hypothetical protein